MPHSGRNETIRTRIGGNSITTYSDGRQDFRFDDADATYFVQEQSDVVSSPMVNGWRQPTSYHNRMFYGVAAHPSSFLIEEQTTSGPGITKNEYFVTQPISSQWFPPSMPDTSQDKDVAAMKALEALRGQKVNLGQNLATARDTARLFTDVVKDLADVADIWRHRKSYRAWREGLQKIPQEVLRYFYGITPTLSDIHGACDELHNRFQQPNSMVFGVTGSAKSNFEDSFTVGFPSFDFTRKGKVKTKVSLWYRLDNEFLATLSRLGVTNPLYVAWDLIPFSFIADWFVPVGNYLDLLTASQGYTFLAGTASRRISTDIRPNNPNRAYMVGTISVSARLGNVRGVQEWYERGVYTSEPFPSIHLKSPISSTHIAEALSLLLTNLRL